MQSTFWPESARRCVFCHDDIPSLLTEAHHYDKRERLANPGRPGIEDSYPLCWCCHNGLLHAGIISVEEVREAAAATLAGTRKVTHDEVYRRIKADLSAERRRVKWNFDTRTPEERSDATRRARRNRPGAAIVALLAAVLLASAGPALAAPPAAERPYSCRLLDDAARRRAQVRLWRMRSARA
jgi:hypothetical protein